MSKKNSLCLDVKTGWDKAKIDKAVTDKEERQVLEAQEKIKKEESAVIECQGNDHKIWTKCKGSFINSRRLFAGQLLVNGNVLR